MHIRRDHRAGIANRKTHVLDDTQSRDALAPHGRSSDTIDALSRARQSVLQQATALVARKSPVPFIEHFDALPNVTSLLMTSLEELKVAEEELRAQNDLLVEQRGAVDRLVHHYRQLFEHSPAPAIVTDVYGSILEVNATAAALFRREAAHMEHKPIQVLVAPAAREEFRRQLSRLSIENGVTDWRLTFHRVGDVPVEVSAAVSFIRGIGRAGNGVLYWMLRVLG